MLEIVAYGLLEFRNGLEAVGWISGQRSSSNFDELTRLVSRSDDVLGRGSEAGLYAIASTSCS
jgi:hypothetical protein